MPAKDLFKIAQETYRTDRRSSASQFARLVKENPESEDAWLGLGLSLENLQERIYCLRRVLRLNPENKAAHQALDALQLSQPDISISSVIPPRFQEGLSREGGGSPPGGNAEGKTPYRSQSFFRKFNWVLLIGAVLVGAILVIAIFGPSWAPQDPMAEHYTLRVDGKIRTPPYPPFKVEGYILGTDSFGRDLWSRVLWGVRPTIIMVVTVAVCRLVVGTIMGLIIGWSRGRVKRFMESLLSTILSVPVLIIAIIGIYLTGIQQGLLAFIIGLGITGWAETARLVSEQTQLIKKQAFIDAVRSMGASERYILFVHVLRHILPLIWMLFAFEMSSTLLVSAELGFLGYYIGGGVYVEISDFAVQNISGLPELGQMLSTALVKLSDPSALIVVGSFIFLGVLGFNLLGEGLRRETSIERIRKRRLFGVLPQDWGYWVERKILGPVSDWFASHKVVKWGITISIVLLMVLWVTNKFLYLPEMGNQNDVLTVPGNHLWASERHDPYGTLWVPVSITSTPQISWSIPIPGGPSGGPAVNAEGVVYISGIDQVLLAIDPSGTILWESTLEAVPVGGPALDDQGNIYVADQTGGISAFSTDGTLLWYTQASTVREATAGPIVSEEGIIYVTIIDTVAALSRQGELLWRVGAAEIYAQVPPRLSTRDDMVFLLNSALATSTGTHQNLNLMPEAQLIAQDPAYFSGADGKDYYRVGHSIMDWQLTESGAVAGQSRTWQYRSLVVFNPYDQGVTPRGLAWMYYSTLFGDSRIVWIDKENRVVGNYRFPRIEASLIAIGGEDEAYLCGPTGARVECISVAVTQQEPTWSIMIDDAPDIAGGALIPGRLYIAITGDSLYALDQPQE